MDPWDHIRRAATDRRSGSVEVAMRASEGLRDLTGRRDVMRAARILLRAHPAMAPLWTLLAEVLESGADGAATFAERLLAETEASVDAIRWVITGRSTIVLTHSSSATVEQSLHRVRGRVSRVYCTTSLPGGEGRALARRLERASFQVELVADSEIARACAHADVALVGADAVTEDAVINKVGTRLVALAALDAGVSCYALASSSKLLPARVASGVAPPEYEHTPLHLFDAVVGERGARRPGSIRRAAASVAIPEALEKILR